MIKSLKTKLFLAIQSIACIVLAIIVSTPVNAALSDAILDFYNENGIYYYNPIGSGISCISGNNASYSGAQVLSEATWNLIQENQPFYEAAAEKYGFPWQVIAAIHYKENSNQRSNPGNGQGAYQLFSYTNGGKNSNAFYPEGPISDEEFQRQTDIAAGIINTMASGMDLNTTGGVKRLFFKYNGTAGKYITRAKNMGFSDEDAKNGEGSPYVMNRFDPLRDPTSDSMSPLWRGMFVGDGQWSDTATTTSFGAFVVYTALGGSTSGGECSDGGLVAGGMTLEQAQEFMGIYKALQDEYRNCRTSFCSPWRIQYIPECGTAYSNCVGLSQYFINRYTTIGDTLSADGSSGGVGGLPNGNQVVSRLLSSFSGQFTNGGNTPRAYAIFSTTTQSGQNHTGVVLGVDIGSGKVITGEAGCGNYNFTGVYEHTIQEMSNGNYIFAYTDAIIKLGGSSSSGGSSSNGNPSTEKPVTGKGSDVTIIGDSITQGSEKQIGNMLPGADLNYEIGRTFTTGISIAKNMNLRDKVVFALGTNSPILSPSQIQEAIDAIGSDREIYFVTNYGKADYSNNNTFLKAAARDNSNVHIIDWAGAVSADPSKYLASDSIHPSASGQKLFADLIYQAVSD